MLEATYQAIVDTLAKASHVLIVSHRKPDGDTAGAGLAVAHYLQLNHISFSYYCADTVGPTLKFLPNAHVIGPHEEVWAEKKFDVAIVLDSGDLRHAGVATKLLPKTHPYTLINIDHHITNELYGDINLVDSAASSTCELVFRVFNHVQAIDRTMANCLLTGLVTDTGSFSNLATTASSIQSAAQLLAQGANLRTIAQQTLSYRPYETLRLWGRALQRLHHDPLTGMVVTVLTLDDIRECQADDEAVSGISNFLNTLQQANDKAILVLTQTEPGVIKGSMRTTNPLLDVAQFAKLYGGGGHKKAAGFTIKGTLHHTPHGYHIIPPSVSSRSDRN